MKKHNYKSAIVHLSDIECGVNNRADSGRFQKGYSKCAEHLANDLKEILFTEHGFSPVDVGLVVSGDVADKGEESEYEEAFALIDEIRKTVKILPSQTAVVPGNHDINWKSCEDAFNEANRLGKPCERSEKLKNFNSFLERICGRTVVPEGVLSFDEFARLGVALVGFDSTYPCSFDSESNYGGIRYETIGESGKKALKHLLKQNDRLIPMAVFHHNLYPLQTGDSSYLHNHEEIRDWLHEAGFGVCLCGHEHRPTELDIRYEDIDLSVTGSFGLNEKTLPRSGARTNKYRILLINPEGESKILLRELNPPGKVDGIWQADSVCESILVRFRRPHLPRVDPDTLKSSIKIKSSRPVEVRDGRFVVSMQLKCKEEYLRCINSVLYRPGNHCVYADNRESYFLADDILEEVPQHLYTSIESTSGPLDLDPVVLRR